MIYACIVSHNHARLIRELNVAAVLAKSALIKLYIYDNTGEESLVEFCKEHSIEYLARSSIYGFGSNNNFVFESIRREVGDTSRAFFMTLNPDVIIHERDVISLSTSMMRSGAEIGTVDLRRDREFKIPDFNARRFPNAIDFLASFFGLSTQYYIDKTKLTGPTSVDWVTGSLIMLKFSAYIALSGFDERYHMYCEDLDLCYRARSEKNFEVTLYPAIKAIHLGSFDNRRILSRHFFWHIISVIQYLIYRKAGLRNVGVQ